MRSSNAPSSLDAGSGDRYTLEAQVALPLDVDQQGRARGVVCEPPESAATELPRLAYTFARLTVLRDRGGQGLVHPVIDEQRLRREEQQHEHDSGNGHSLGYSYVSLA